MENFHGFWLRTYETYQSFYCVLSISTAHDRQVFETTFHPTHPHPPLCNAVIWIHIHIYDISTCSYSPNINIIESPFPEPCKPKGQIYCSSLFRKIAKPKEDEEESNEDHHQQQQIQQQIQMQQQIDEDQQVVLIREMEAFTETLLVTSAKLDCVRLSKTKILKALDERSDKNELKCCIFPLFNWCVYFIHLLIY